MLGKNPKLPSKCNNDIFKETNLKINDVEEYAVDIGPGSFTGIRVAIATLQGMLVSQPEKEVRTFLSSDFIYLSSLTKNKNYLIDKKLAVLNELEKTPLMWLFIRITKEFLARKWCFIIGLIKY